MNNLRIYESNEFGKLSVEVINDEPYFIGKEITDKLGYQNGSRDISRHVDPEDTKFVTIFYSGQNREMLLINESGLYSLIMGSKLDNARSFKRWVTSEVLPSIRKNGGYIVGQESLNDEELLSKALMVAQNKIIERDKLLKEQQPKVLFADSVSASNKCILVRELAKYLSQSGVEIGEKRLFAALRRNRYLISAYGSDRNTPSQKSMDLGLFKLKKTIITHANGYTTITPTPLVTGKGQVYFLNKFLKGELA